MKRINSIVKHELRKALCNKFDGKCAYCDRQIGMRGTVDHYMPQALGGTNAKDNLRWCCTTCNGEKADMHPDEWAQRMPARKSTSSKSQRKIELVAKSAALSRVREESKRKEAA